MSKKPGKHRWSLTLLYSSAFFLIQLAAVLITAALSFLLTKLGVLDNLGIPRNSGFAMLIVMLLISVLVGSVVAIGAVKIPLRPFNRLINNIDRLAAGDFTARMHYGKVMGDNPVFQELSESFNAMAEELENTQMLRSDFINNFSHEFKTPIVSIAGFAKLLRRGNLTDAQKEEYLAIIEEESLRLAAMATNVMNLTKVENQTILTDLTTFNLSEQIRACVLLLEEKWSRKELDLDLEFPEYTIRANEELLKQVWINLLDNAIKYSPNYGEIGVRIPRAGDAGRHHHQLRPRYPQGQGQQNLGKILSGGRVPFLGRQRHRPCRGEAGGAAPRRHCHGGQRQRLDDFYRGTAQAGRNSLSA